VREYILGVGEPEKWTGGLGKSSAGTEICRFSEEKSAARDTNLSAGQENSAEKSAARGEIFAVEQSAAWVKISALEGEKSAAPHQTEGYESEPADS
jgi:hypothetical protein